LPYSVLAYANGPGGVSELPRTVPETEIDTVQQALVPLSTIEIDGSIETEESHGGDDVALYANGHGLVSWAVCLSKMLFSTSLSTHLAEI